MIRELDDNCSKVCIKITHVGQVRIRKKQTKITPKIDNFVVTYIFVGYNTNSGDDVHMMWNPKTNIFYNTRDIIWLENYVLLIEINNSNGGIHDSV